MNILPFKRCAKCGELKLKSEFHKSKQTKDGLKPWCKACRQIEQRQTYAKNKSVVLERSRVWHKNNPDKVSAKSKKWRDANPDYLEYHRQSVAEWARSNKEKISAWNKEYRTKNAEALSVSQRAWRAANKEVIAQKRRKDYYANQERYLEQKRQQTARNPIPHRAKAKLWRMTHPDQVKAQAQKRRARVANCGGKITGRQWAELKAKYNYTCLCCRKQEPEIKLTLDHVIPLVKGGQNVIENAQPLCLVCNSRKGTKETDYR